MNNVCEEEPISMFWAPDGLNELKEQRFEFPFILIGKSTMELLIGQSWRVVKPWYTGQNIRILSPFRTKLSLFSSARIIEWKINYRS